MHRTGRPLTQGWRSVLIVTWLLAFACTLAVAVSSRTVGRPVWWLGPVSDPAPSVAIVVPVAIVFAPLLAAFRSWHRAPGLSVVCSLLLMAIGIPDTADRLSVAIAMWTVGGAVLVTNIGVTVGRRQYR